MNTHCFTLLRTIYTGMRCPGGFRWLSKHECDHFDVSQVSEEGPHRFIIEADIYYLPELSDLNNDYPVAPEKVTVTSEMISTYKHTTYETLYNQRYDKGDDEEKSVPTF